VIDLAHNFMLRLTSVKRAGLLLRLFSHHIVFSEEHYPIIISVFYHIKIVLCGENDDWFIICHSLRKLSFEHSNMRCWHF